LIAATKASAVSWPRPGNVISRRQAAEALVMRLMSVLIVATKTEFSRAGSGHQPHRTTDHIEGPFLIYLSTLVSIVTCARTVLCVV
jgi:hypothetical protein